MSLMQSVAGMGEPSLSSGSRVPRHMWRNLSRGVDPGTMGQFTRNVSRGTYGGAKFMQPLQTMDYDFTDTRSRYV